MTLQEIIRKRIASGGPVSFHDFMEMALYYPRLGYYTSPANKIGKDGDYFTSAYITPIFGQMIARQLEEMWHLLGGNKFTIIEYGAGNGLLTLDILQQLQNNLPFYKALDYCIIEKSSAMRCRQQAVLPQKVRWVNAISELAPATGCVFSNELIDNFSVHVVKMDKELKELYIEWQDGLIETWQPASILLKKYLRDLKIELSEGCRIEINLQVAEWIKEIAMALEKGFVLSIDYGGTSSELYSPQKPYGTLSCYYKHTVHHDVYSNIGRQDITAHVNFSALHRFGRQYDLTFGGYSNQLNFLISLGLSSCLRKQEENERGNNVDEIQKQQIINTFLLDMSRKLKVMVLQKGVQTRISGMRMSFNSFEQVHSLP